MARLKTTNDIFNAIAEPKRRALVEVLADGEKTVGELAAHTKWRQPSISKHLAVLREVGLVSERQEGRCRIYSVQPAALRPLHEWMHQFEQYWGGTLAQLDDYLEGLTKPITQKETSRMETGSDDRKS